MTKRVAVIAGIACTAFWVCCASLFCVVTSFGPHMYIR